MSAPHVDRWIGLGDAARLAGISPNSITKAVRKGGRLTTKIVAGRTLYLRTSVEKYAAKRAAKMATVSAIIATVAALMLALTSQGCSASPTAPRLHHVVQCATVTDTLWNTLPTGPRSVTIDREKCA